MAMVPRPWVERIVMWFGGGKHVVAPRSHFVKCERQPPLVDWRKWCRTSLSS